METESRQVRARALEGALEPFAGQVHFSPECHAEYVALGFGGSSGMAGRTQLPDRDAYQLAPAVAALGGGVDDLVAVPTPWGDVIRAEGGYLSPAVCFTWLPDPVAPNRNDGARDARGTDVTA
jgi:hypothetical protein